MRPNKAMKARDNSTLSRDVKEKTISRESAVALLHSTTICPFKFNRYFMCLYCTSKFVHMKDLEQHVDIEHKSITENEIRKSVIRIGRSQPIKVNVLGFNCKLCNDEISSFEDLKHHLIGKHKKLIDLDNDGVLPYQITDTEFNCVLCEKKLGHYRYLNRHINEHYTKFICNQCGVGFASDMRLKVHVLSHEQGSYPCEDCGKIFTKISSKQQHQQRVHLKTKKNKCIYCMETFKDYYQKQKHMLAAHGVQPRNYKCNFCPKEFLRSSHVRAHERQNHLRTQTYNCDLCEFKSYNKGSLKRHMICHSDEKNHTCQVCKKSYARHSTLYEHMKIHNNDRRFACQYCGRAFVQNCSLKGHMKTHHKDCVT